MADNSDQQVPDFLDQSEIDRLLAQTTTTTEAKPNLLRADGARGGEGDGHGASCCWFVTAREEHAQPYQVKSGLRRCHMCISAPM